MELVLVRTYHTDGTNGTLRYAQGDKNQQFICYTIELPWEDNLPQYSCIPEGRYELKKRYSNKFGQHLLVDHVPGRELILIHPANDALKELRGCIAPVSILTGPGKGILSRNAFQKVVSLVYKALESETVFITIQTDQHEFKRKNRSTDPKVL
jgi:hypothetical protein